MAEQVLTNAFLSIAGVDLSDHVRQLTLNDGADAPVDTAMGDTYVGRLAGGIKDWSVAVEFNQDYAANEVDVTVAALVGTSVALIIRADAGAKAATNPEWTGNAILTSYNPVVGSVGDAHITNLQFDGNGALARGV